MKNRFWIMGLTVLFLLTGCSLPLFNKPQVSPDTSTGTPAIGLVGGDRDEHGCIGSAGYQWCPSTGKCQRMWEELCEEFREQFREEAAIRDFADCERAGYPVMESYPRQCAANGNTYTEELSEGVVGIPVDEPLAE
jgi:hypothetical protein